METLFQYARVRSTHSRLAPCIYLGLLLWFSAGTGLGIELLVCTKWKCLPDPSLCLLCQGWLEGTAQSQLEWHHSFGSAGTMLQKEAPVVLRRQVVTWEASHQRGGWGGTRIYGFLDTEDISWPKKIFQSHKRCSRIRPWTHRSHCKKSVEVNYNKIKHKMRWTIFWMDTIF